MALTRYLGYEALPWYTYVEIIIIINKHEDSGGQYSGPYCVRLVMFQMMG